MAALDYANEYPDILSRQTGGSSLPGLRPLPGAALTEQDGKSDLVCCGASPTGPSPDMSDDRARV